ncbi:asparagine synthase-related protein [Streptomyces griseorubiginosus]|uniref:asparagine synthase-related protein n=1 Tax=Streptomyces griseorubiginosus TaxID=67304 RepID=UPI001AD73E0D|nr:asparagine synthase-related protein [Streptomyces griseorubiginosus]MBO4256231.1 asparagine synthase [Streptomyces griseorubiginosus]
MESISVPNGSWFVALPDSDATTVVVDRLRSYVSFTHAHASGRPWIIGSGPDAGPASLVHAAHGGTRLLVRGVHSVTERDLLLWARRIRHLSDVDRLTESLAGSAHVLASIDGQVRAQGTVSGVRKVFHTTVGGVPVAADRADLLASLTGAALDPVRLTARLLAITPAALIEPLWSGVEAVPPDSWLHLDANGTPHTRRWWRPPPQELDRTEGAPALARALADAVAARVRTGATVGSDLSGGLDSTPMSFLASRATHAAGGKLVTVRIGVADPTHDDHVWAERAQRLMDGGHVTHTVFRPGELPDMFAQVAQPITGLDEPTRWIRPVARLRETARRLGAAGAVAHLTGHGGDEVLPVKPNYLHDLMRRRPALARQHLAGMRALRRWSVSSTVQALAERKPYGPWLVGQADDLGTAFPSGNRPLFGWEYPLRLPPWVKREAVAELADRIRERAGAAEPHAPSRSAHTTIDLARQLGAAVRLAETVTADEGAVLQAPYLDDRVIEACLAVRPEERSSPWSYKPLMVEAMRDTMPAESLERATKGEFSDDFFKGQKRHRGQLAELFDQPLLADLGLIDAGTLRHMALAAYPPGLPWSALDATMAAENWLRAQSRPSTSVGGDNRVDHSG